MIGTKAVGQSTNTTKPIDVKEIISDDALIEYAISERDEFMRSIYQQTGSMTFSAPEKAAMVMITSSFDEVSGVHVSNPYLARIIHADLGEEEPL